MPKTARDVPPPLELLCLRALWALEKGNVTAVREIVCQTRPLAYTTIMTVLDRLVRKGKLTRRKVGRSFVYSPEMSRDAMRHAAIRELVDGLFDGSPAALAAFLRDPATGLATGLPAQATPGPARMEMQDRIDTVLL